ncbi:MAG: hypothetical protein QOG72_2416 [Sphingomonadales bacterium]|jgi:hypothetical protein|nr:hypothetical protein [Sphingomonadales bacterium]
MSKPETHGRAIAVLERGFVFVGDVATDDRWIRIGGARSIIRWGTQKHLAQLANEGPQSGTKLGDASDVKAPLSALIAILPVDPAKWNG